MPAVNYNFIIEQGSDFELSFQYNNEQNNPIDLSNKCVVIQWKVLDRIYQFSTGANSLPSNGWTMTANNQGTIQLKLSAKFTKDFNFDSAVYDLDIRETGSDILQNIRLCTGIITIVKRNIPLSSECSNVLAGYVDNLSASPTPNTGNTGTPAPVPTPTITSTSSEPFEDLCLPENCLNLDVYSVIYSGTSLAIPDLSTVSGTVITTDTRFIENIELSINKLNHQSPSDLMLLLSPPSGNKILLSANNKIPAYSGGNFSFMFSNRAFPDKYLYNINNNGICNINNKTNIVNYNNESLLYSFNHLFGASVTGNWTLIAKDTDTIGSGIIDSWKLIITYIPNINEN